MNVIDSDGGGDCDCGDDADYSDDSDVDKVEIEVTLVNVGDVDNGGDGGDDGDGDDCDDDDLNEDDGECIGGARVMCNWNGARNLQNSILLYNTFKSL